MCHESSVVMEHMLRRRLLCLQQKKLLPFDEKLMEAIPGKSKKMFNARNEGDVQGPYQKSSRKIPGGTSCHHRHEGCQSLAAAEQGSRKRLCVSVCASKNLANTFCSQ